MTKAMLCVHRQTFERRILAEHLAMELDKRIWRLEEWYTCTQPGSKGEFVPLPCIVDNPDFAVRVQLPEEVY